VLLASRWQWLAPEAIGRIEYNELADIYSFAIVQRITCSWHGK